MKIEGQLNASGLKFAIVSSRFNDLIVERLTAGAVDAFLRHGVNEDDIDKVFVPGAFEIPATALLLAKSLKYDGIVCLGAVIKGETTHYDYVCNEVAKGISHVSLSTGVPCAFGVLTTDNLEQAFLRAGSKAGNKGFESALTAIEMANLFKKLKLNII